MLSLPERRRVGPWPYSCQVVSYYIFSFCLFLDVQPKKTNTGALLAVAIFLCNVHAFSSFWFSWRLANKLWQITVTNWNGVRIGECACVGTPDCRRPTVVVRKGTVSCPQAHKVCLRLDEVCLHNFSVHVSLSMLKCFLLPKIEMEVSWVSPIILTGCLMKWWFSTDIFFSGLSVN